MNTKSQKISLFFFLFIFFTTSTPTWSAEVVSISITSSQSGLNGKTTGKIQIDRTPFGYVGNLDIQHVGPPIRKKLEEFKEFPVPTEYIKNFQNSLQTDPINKLDLNQFNITQEWIRKRLEEALDIDFKKYSLEEYPTLETRRALILDRLVDVKKTRLKLQRHYKSEWFDDYPKVEVLVNLNDGNSIALHSKAQHLFMLPWTIKRNDKTAITYDIEISKALSKILTENIMNYQRIKGDSKFLRSFIWIFDISPSHQILWAERDFGNQLGPIYREFYVGEADVSSRTEGSCCKENNGPQKRLFLSLGHKNWPDNLMAGIKLPVNQNKLDWTHYSTKIILKDADHLLGIPWLKKHMGTFPLANFRFTYYDKGLSIDSKSLKKTLSKLKGKKNFEWKERDFPYSEDIISLIIRDSYSHWSSWLVFPDKTILVVSAKGNSELKGAAEPFSDHLKVWSDLTGKLISPSGEIMHP